jgi:hypothetical protein
MGKTNENETSYLEGEQKVGSELAKAIAVGSGREMTEEDLIASREAYEVMRNADIDSPQTVGLYGEDLEKVLRDPYTIFLTVEHNGKPVHVPLLVPTKDIEWYNKQLLERQMGQTLSSYYFTQIKLPTDFASEQKILAQVRAITADRGYIVQERLASQPNQLMKWKHQLGSSDARVEVIGLGEEPARIDLFVGNVEVSGNENRIIKQAPTFLDVYREAVEEGEIPDGTHEGASVADVIEGMDAERLWKIYKDPFEQLGEAHALEAGFTHDVFLEILRDPNIAKVVHRVQGEITTLMFFVSDLSYYPWFNKEYFEKHYSQALATNNILVFPGIVSDESKRGMNYSYPVVQLTTNILARRGSDFVIAFECSEISSQYIPSIVKSAIELSGSAHVNNLDEPESQIVFEALSV